jgi:hypothetical protein
MLDGLKINSGVKNNNNKMKITPQTTGDCYDK